jgi:class 3 adenylate cyclase/tetratricopeptide (TPR) repeat protein
MRCSNCGFENPSGMKFCGQCTNALALVCPQCQFENPPGFKFCGQCTTPLAVRGKAPRDNSLTRISEATPDAAVAAGERKTVTALFADIKGSMELMEDLDPEEARAIVDPALKLMIEAARRYDGYIVQSTGDGIFALFGAPVAHEDHPQRALCAALRMQEEMRRYAERLRADRGINLQARVGVNTGEVVVRSIHTQGGHAEYTPIGHSAGLAARLQALASPGAVVIGDGVRRLAEGYFQLKRLGPARIKGVNDPIEIFEVTGLGPLRTRLQVAAQRGLTKFVGRQAELDQMKHALELASGGHGQIVAALGEPGVGKSRLFFEFKATALSGCLVLEAYSVSHEKATAYLPVIELLREYFCITAEDDSRLRREKVIGRIIGLDRSFEDSLPYVFGLLGIQEGDDPLAQMDAQIRRRRTQDALKRILLRESLSQPVILVFEDLHWIDSETQALLNLLADSIANARILLVVNYRPEYRHEWGHRTHYTQLRLDPLSSEGAKEMLDALLGYGLLNDQGKVPGVGIEEVKRFVLERTQGNPFFMEEMVHALFEEGVLVRNGTLKVVRPLSQAHVPATVQGVLAARIDRLPADEKELLQTLAVIGKEFPLSLVRPVAERSEAALDAILSRLQAAEFIYEQPAFPDVEYRFKHALSQEVAYNSVLLERRKLLHEKVGSAIESLYRGCLDDHLDELAHHYNHSDNAAKAVEYLRLAAVQALGRSHHSEAIAYGASALDVLRKLPDKSERLRPELAIQMLTAQASMSAIGYNAPEVARALGRAEAICKQIGSAVEMFPVVSALATHHLGFGRHRLVHELAVQLVEIAENQKSKALLAEAYCQLGFCLWWEGRFRDSLTYQERAIANFQPGQKIGAGVDAMTIAMYRVAHSLWFLGYADKALHACIRSIEHATGLAHSASILVARLGSCLLRMIRRDREAVQETETLAAIAEECGSSSYDWVVLPIRSQTLLDQGSVSEALSGLLQTVEHQRLAGTKLALTIHLGPSGRSLWEGGKSRSGNQTNFRSSSRNRGELRSVL